MHTRLHDVPVLCAVILENTMETVMLRKYLKSDSSQQKTIVIEDRYYKQDLLRRLQQLATRLEAQGESARIIFEAIAVITKETK